MRLQHVIPSLIFILYLLQPILVHAKPGILHFWRIDGATTDNGEYIRTIRLQTQKVSVGSSSLAPTSGLLYLEDQDALVVGLFDGSFHTVYFASTSPTLDNDLMLVDGMNPSFTSSQLSKAVRAAFAKAEGGNVQKADVNRTGGLTTFDGSSTVAWFHEYDMASILHRFNLW